RLDRETEDVETGAAVADRAGGEDGGVHRDGSLEAPRPAKRGEGGRRPGEGLELGCMRPSSGAARHLLPDRLDPGAKTVAFIGTAPRKAPRPAKRGEGGRRPGEGLEMGRRRPSSGAARHLLPASGAKDLRRCVIAVPP